MLLALVFAVSLTSAATPAETPAPAELPLDGIATIQLQVPVEVEEADFTPVSPAAKPQRGFCRCTCSATPNCSTNADCGGGLCLKGPTCC